MSACMQNASVPQALFWHFYALGCGANACVVCLHAAHLLATSSHEGRSVRFASAAYPQDAPFLDLCSGVGSLVALVLLQMHLMRRLVESVAIMKCATPLQNPPCFTSPLMTPGLPRDAGTPHSLGTCNRPTSNAELSSRSVHMDLHHAMATTPSRCRYPAGSRMHVLAYVYGLAYYAVLPLTLAHPPTRLWLATLLLPSERFAAQFGGMPTRLLATRAGESDAQSGRVAAVAATRRGDMPERHPGGCVCGAQLAATAFVCPCALGDDHAISTSKTTQHSPQRADSLHSCLRRSPLVRLFAASFITRLQYRVRPWSVWGNWCSTAATSYLHRWPLMPHLRKKPTATTGPRRRRATCSGLPRPLRQISCGSAAQRRPAPRKQMRNQAHPMATLHLRAPPRRTRYRAVGCSSGSLARTTSERS